MLEVGVHIVCCRDSSLGDRHDKASNKCPTTPYGILDHARITVARGYLTLRFIRYGVFLSRRRYGVGENTSPSHVRLIRLGNDKVM